MIVHRARELGEEVRLFHRRVAAADDQYRLALEEEAVAGRAGRHAVAHQPRLGFDAEQRAVAPVETISASQVNSSSLARKRNGRFERSTDSTSPVDELGAEARGLSAEPLHHLGPHQALGKARVVLDLGGDRQLAARLSAFDDQRREVRARGVESGREAGRTGAEDEDFVMLRGHTRLRPRFRGCAGCIGFPTALQASRTARAVVRAHERSDPSRRKRPRTHGRRLRQGRHRATRARLRAATYAAGDARAHPQRRLAEGRRPRRRAHGRHHGRQANCVVDPALSSAAVDAVPCSSSARPKTFCASSPPSR